MREQALAVRWPATPVAIGGWCAAIEARASIEQARPVGRTNRHMSSSTLLTMILIGAGSGALALAMIRGLALLFPRARA
jgi:hypothetical protein